MLACHRGLQARHEVAVPTVQPDGILPPKSRGDRPLARLDDGAVSRVTHADQPCLPSFNTVIPPPQTPEVGNAVLLPLVGEAFGGGASVITRRRGHVRSRGKAIV